MQAFHNDAELKSNLLIEVEKHRLADQIISGTYGSKESGKWQGCAVGCSIRSYNILHGTKIHTGSHEQYPKLFGIPEILARLEDRIFEGLPNELKAEWPGKFFNAISVGADLTAVWPKFAIWLLVDAERGVIRHTTSKKTKSAIERVAELYRTNGTKEQFLEASKNAADADAYAYASDAAAAAAADAADADAYAYASDAAAAAAAAAAADAAAAAAYAAADAAAAADYAAADYAADAADAADAYARQNAFKAQSEKLLELMSESV